MGFSPQQVNAMSMWQFFAALEGFVEANSAKGDRLSSKEADDIFDWVDVTPGPPGSGPTYVFDDDAKLVRR